MGVTPFTKDSLAAKQHTLDILKPGYFKKRIEADIGVNSTYHLNIKLVSKKRVQNFRRVSLGALGLLFSGLSVIMESKVDELQKEKEGAWDHYMQLNHTTSEYDNLYKTYTDKVNESNKLTNIRNTFISIAGISVIGFCVSIPF
jgi:hypothetical protein